jgi:hypothetical protein
VLSTLTVFGCEVVLLEAQDPVSCLSVHEFEAVQPGQSRVVNAQVKFMSIVISLSLVQGLLVVCSIGTFCISDRTLPILTFLTSVLTVNSGWR